MTDLNEIIRSPFGISASSSDVTLNEFFGWTTPKTQISLSRVLVALNLILLWLTKPLQLWTFLVQLKFLKPK